MEYYGLDIHKLSITYTCMNEEGRVLRRGQVATTPEAIRGICPSCQLAVQADPCDKPILPPFWGFRSRQLAYSAERVKVRNS